ncbi:MAG: universal stress protein [Deltaproteobacteria bacterium]|nr:universal stress protein [Deltaproteobacteria bacterium]
MFEKILYPTDFSDVSQKALNYVKGLKAAGTTKVVLLRVISDKSMECIGKGIALAGKDVGSFLSQAFQSLQEEARQQIRPVEDELKAAGFDVTTRIESGVPQTKILELAESEGVSAIVLGSHGRSNLSSALLGSVSDHVIRHAKQPVLVIKRN